MPGTRLHVERRGKEYQATPCDSDSHMALLDEVDHHLDTGQITSNEAVHRLTTALQDDPLWLDGLLEQATLHDEMLNDGHRKANRKCAFEIATKALPEKFESPQMRVGSGGASSMPPQQRNSIEINAPGEWKP